MTREEMATRIKDAMHASLMNKDVEAEMSALVDVLAATEPKAQAGVLFPDGGAKWLDECHAPALEAAGHHSTAAIVRQIARALAQVKEPAPAADSGCRWPIKPLKTVQVELPDGTEAMCRPSRAIFDAYSVQELENRLKAPAAGHTPEPVAWMYEHDDPDYSGAVFVTTGKPSGRDVINVRPLYTSPNVPASQAQGAGSHE